MPLWVAVLGAPQVPTIRSGHDVADVATRESSLQASGEGAGRLRSTQADQAEIRSTISQCVDLITGRHHGAWTYSTSSNSPMRSAANAPGSIAAPG